METATLDAPTSAAGLVPAWVGCRAYGSDDARLGTVGDVLFDAQTHAPAWVLVVLTAGEHRFVLAPARGLRHRAGGVTLICDREQLRSAPTTAAPPDGLAPGHARELAAHYGVRCGAGPWHGVVEPALVGTLGRVRMG